MFSSDLLAEPKVGLDESDLEDETLISKGFHPISGIISLIWPPYSPLSAHQTLIRVCAPFVCAKLWKRIFGEKSLEIKRLEAKNEYGS